MVFRTAITLDPASQWKIEQEDRLVASPHTPTHLNDLRKIHLQEVLKSIVQDSSTKPWFYVDHVKVPQSGE